MTPRWRRGRDGPLPRHRRRRRVRGRDVSILVARRGGRRQAPLRLPDGHLPHLRRPPLRRVGCGTCAPARSTARRARWSASASTRPRDTSRSTSRMAATERHGDSKHRHRDREPAAPAHPRADRGDRRGVPGDPRRGLRRPRRARRRTTSADHRVPPPPGGAVADRADGLALLARLGARDDGPVGREDPREHGDRPQHPARPVGLDERPGTSTPRPGTGTPPRRPPPGSTPTTTSTTPSPTSSARTRTSATRSCASTRSRSGTRSTCCSRSTTSLLACFFEWGVAVHDLDFEAIGRGRSRSEQVRDELKAIGVKARRQIVKDYIAVPRAERQGLEARRCTRT